MQPIWTKPDFLELTVGSCWGVPSEILGCDGGSWYSVSSSARFYLNVLEKLQSVYLSTISNSKNYFMLNNAELEDLRFCVSKIKNSITYISEEFPWSRLKYMYEKTILRKSTLDYREFHRFIVDTVIKVKNLENKHSIVLPGVICLEESKKPLFLLYVVSRNDEGDLGSMDRGYNRNAKYSFSVVNVSGFGTEYHLYGNSLMNNNPTQLLRDSVIVISDVLTERLVHSAFWISLYRLSFISSSSNIHYLYTVLLPFLNGKNLFDNWSGLNGNSDTNNQNDIRSSFGNIWVPNPKRKHFGSSNKLLQSVLQFLFQSYSTSMFKYLKPEFKAVQFKLYLNWSLLNILRDDFNNCIIKPDSLSLVNASTVISVFLKNFSNDISNFSFGLSVTKIFNKVSNIGNNNNANNELNVFERKDLFSLSNSIPFREWYEHLNHFKMSFEKIFLSSFFGFGLGNCTISQNLVSSPIKSLALHSTFSNFGQFRLDGPNIMLLAGESNEPNVDIPVELDLINKKINSVEDIIIILETCISSCILLSNQVESIKNSYLIRFKLIQYIFENLIPIPLPWNHEQKKRCFWFNIQNKILRSQQVYLLNLLNTIVRHFMASSFSINFNNKIPQFDRLITMGIISCIADNIARCLTSDFKSPLSINLTGNHQGPKIWFYVDFLNFQTITDFGIYMNPSTVITRTMILDYFYSTRNFKSDKNMKSLPIFAFEEKPGVIDEGTIQLLMQISTQYGFSNYISNKEDQKKNKTYSIPYFFTGETKEMLDIIPEFYSYRDIIFYFKYLITLNREYCPEIQSWMPSSCHLLWSYNNNKDLFTVRSFDRNLECIFTPLKNIDGKQHKGLWSSFTGWLTNSNDKGYSKNFTKLSDPNTIINSFDSLNLSNDSFSSIFYASNTNNSNLPSSSELAIQDNFADSGHNFNSISVNDENDILYIRPLPNLSDQLLPNEIECIFQYLTTPYLRIPLLLQFFSDENRINSLSSTYTQHIIWVSILEPWQWSPPMENINKEMLYENSFLVPIQENKYISTPCGLLFNELTNSPEVIFKSLEELLLIALDKDTGSFSGNNSRIILFVLRISIIISNYTKHLIRYYDYWKDVNVYSNSKTEMELTKCNEIGDFRKIEFNGDLPMNGICRGFEVLFEDLEKISILKLSFRRLRYIIEHLYLKMIVDWMKKALKELNISALCVLYAHIAGIYGNISELKELDLSSVTLLLSSLVFLTTHYSIEDHNGNIYKKTSTQNERKSSFNHLGSSVFYSNSSLYINTPWDYTTNNSLGIPDLEIISIQTRTRYLIIKWLTNHTKEANLVLDTVVNAVAVKSIGIIDLEIVEGNEKLTPTTREWIQLPGINGNGRFVPLNEIPSDLYEWLSYESIESIKDNIGSRFGSKNSSNNSYKSMNWWRLRRKFSKILNPKNLKVRSNQHEINPEVNMEDYTSSTHLKYLSSRTEYNEWFKTILSINTETEINVQFSLFSLKNSNLRVVGNWIYDFEDFKEVVNKSDMFVNNNENVFSNEFGNQYQSADIANTQNLYWCKLIGSRIDLYRWEPFHKTNQITFRTKYDKNNLPKGAEWIVELFEPWKALFLNGVSTIYIDDTKFNSNSNVDSKDEKKVDCLFGNIYKPPELTNTVRMQFLYPLYEPGEGPESPNPKTASNSHLDENHDDLSTQTTEIVTHSLKEIVIHRFPPVIMVYDIVEQGRLYYRQLCHTSNVSYSLGSLENKFITPFLRTKDYSENLNGIGTSKKDSNKLPSIIDSNIEGRFTLASGLPLKRGRKPSQSLVIMRDYYKYPIGTEMYVPSRFLLGLIPQVFLETHEFWQSQITGNIRGYPKKNKNNDFKSARNAPNEIYSKNKLLDDLKDFSKTSKVHDDELYLIDIFIFASSKPSENYGFISDGISIIQRRYIHNQSNVQTLINIQTLYGSSMEMSCLFETLQRLEDVSHILLWSNDNPIIEKSGKYKEELSQELSLDLIEFPRLHLTFKRKERDRSNTILTTIPNNLSSSISTGTIRYVCEQHSGLYISWRNIYDYPLTCELLKGLPHSVLLENDDGDFFILVPATVKPVLIPPVYSNLSNCEKIDNSISLYKNKGLKSNLKEQKFVNKSSSLVHVDNLSFLFSNTNVLAENIENITASPGQYVASMASIASQTLFYTAISALSNTTKNVIDSTLKKANEVLNSGSIIHVDTSTLATDQQNKDISNLYSLLFKGTYVLDRGDHIWHSQLGTTRHYLYPIHTSKSFLFINSVVSGLYLMLWRFLEQQFEAVLSILDIATSSDMESSTSLEDEWNNEEKQLWQVFNNLGNSWDCHPDAHACRLKIWLYCIRHLSSCNTGVNKNTRDFNTQNFNCTWDISLDIENYVNKFSNVSANCRLSIEEELEILQSFPHFVKDNPDINNRLNLITTVYEKQKYLKMENDSNSISIIDNEIDFIEFQVFNPQIPQIDDFDGWMDITCLGKSISHDVRNINNPLSSLWENLANVMGTLSMPPKIQEKNTSKIINSNLSDSSMKLPEGNIVLEYESLISGEYATEFIVKFLNRSSITKIISNAISATVSNISVNNSSNTTSKSNNSSLEKPFISDVSNQINHSESRNNFVSAGGNPVYLSDWIFIYNLLTGQFPLQIIPGETSHTWGVLFTRSLPVWDWKSPNILISILRLLILNPNISLSSKMPKFVDERQQSKIQIGAVFKSHESFQNLIKEVTNILTEEYNTGNLVIHSKYYNRQSKELNSSSISLLFTSMFTLSSNSLRSNLNCTKARTISPNSPISRWCVSLNRGDYNCDKRQIGCINLSDCVITKQDLYCYSKSPIFIVSNINKYLIPSQNNFIDNKNNFIYDLPGKLFNHPISKTTIGRSSLERYRNDINEYTNKIKEKLDFNILGLNYEKILEAFEKYNSINGFNNLPDLKKQNLHESGFKNPTWEEIRQGIVDLRMMLLQLFYKDGQFIDTAIRKLSEIANCDPKNTKKERISKDEREALLFWSSCFGKLSGKEPILHFDYLVSQLMNSSSNLDLKKLNLFVDNEDIEIIHSLTAATMMTVNRRSQVSIALIQLRDIMCYISSIQDELRLKSSCIQGSEKKFSESKWLRRSLMSLEMKLRNVARVLSYERYYMKLVNKQTNSKIDIKDLELIMDENIVAIYDPRLLVFEFAYNILLRKDQVDLIYKLYDSAIKGRSICHQMIMGAGKTTVISPLLSLLLGDSQRLVIQIVPHALLEFTRNVLRSRFSCIVKKRILKFQFHRNSTCTPELYKKLVHAKEQKAIILCHPTSIKSLFLKTIYLFRILRYWSNDVTTISGLKMALKYISYTTGINKSKLSTLTEKTSSIKQIFGLNGSKDSKAFGITNRYRRNVNEISKKLNTLLNNEDKEEIYLQYKKELDLCLRILHIFKHQSVVIVDEIDMILHPLKSELHWPIGEKSPIDLSNIASFQLIENSETSNCNDIYVNNSRIDSNSYGMRWLIPWYLIEALLTKPDKFYLLSNEQALKSASIIGILLQIQKKIDVGISNRFIQNNPHLILLDREYYQKEIRPLLIKWIIFIVRLHKFTGLSDDLCESYINSRGQIRNNNDPNNVKLYSVIDNLDDYSMKILNIIMDWVNDYLPHIFQLVHRVSFGLLDEVKSGISRSNWLGFKNEETGDLNLNQNSPISRHLLSIPFIGKDTPSVASEFSHPDIVIGLTILSYRYHGLRKNDIYCLLDNLKRSFENGYGQLKDRPSVLEFNKWVKLSGGRVRGTKRSQLKNLITCLYNESDNLKSNIDLLQNDQKLSKTDVRNNDLKIDQMNLLWPLDVLNLNDDDQLNQLHKLLRYQPLAINAYLCRMVFPILMEYSDKQISASGQEIGGEILFSVRIGFSGTPSELLPAELGKCEYERGSDGEMINYLTNGSIISSIEILDINWTVEEFLLNISRNRDKDTHALIDTGAFITGYTNEQVSEFLLRNGLKDIDAIVFIDDRDKQMIMLRDGYRIIEISQCGISLERRFAFYDHVHSIGQDIKHTPLAKAILTISKDMVFRDFAQGAYRMRQLGQGQTIHIVLQAQVADLIEKNAIICNMITERNLFTKSNASLNSNILEMELPNSDLLSLSCSFEIPNSLLFLRCLCGWLIIQSITREFEQNQLLCVQSLENIWRKESLNRMINEHVQWEDSNNKIKDRIVDIFVENLSYEISSTLPFNIPLKDQLRNKFSENKEIFENKSNCSDENNKLVEYLIGQVEEMSLYKSCYFHNNISFDREMEKELEMEMEMEIYQEREQEQEKEEEKQQEKQQENENIHSGNKLSKPNLNISRDLWPFEYLLRGEYLRNLILVQNRNQTLNQSTSTTSKRKIEDLATFAFFSTSKAAGIHREDIKMSQSIENIFLSLSEYVTPKDNISLDFPNHFRFTTNLYNPKIVNSFNNNNIQQRLNNINIIIECDFLFSENEDSEIQKIYNQLPKDYLLQLKDAFAIFDGSSTGKISLDDLSDLLKTLNWVEDIVNLEKEILKLLNNKLYKTEINNVVEKKIKTVDNLLKIEKEQDSGIVLDNNLLEFMNDHPWENSSNNIEKKLLEMDSNDSIFENKYLNDIKLKSISFEELYDALNLVLNTRSSKFYIAVTLEEAQSIRWFMHNICSIYKIEELRSFCGLETKNFKIKIYHLSNTLLLIDEIDEKILNRINPSGINEFLNSNKVECINKSNSQYSKYKENYVSGINEFPVTGINLLELQAQSIYKFVNSESNFSKQEVSVASRTLQNNTCKLRKEFYLNIRKCRRRKVTEFSIYDNNLSSMFTTPNESAVLQCRGLASRLITRLEKYNMTIFDFFKYLDRNHTGVISSIYLYASLEFLQIAPNPVDYSRIIYFIFNNGSEDRANVNDFVYDQSASFYNISITQESFIKAFSIQTTTPNSIQTNNENKIVEFMPKINETELVEAELKLSKNLTLYRDHYDSDIGVKIRYFGVNFLSKIKCKLVQHNNFEKIFEIPGILSIWNPEQLEGKYRGVMKKNKERICLGQYGAEINYNGHTNNTFHSYILELTDNSSSSMLESTELKKFVNITFPYPKKFKPLFKGSLFVPNLNSETGVFTIWKPIPPNKKFVSLGIIVTKGENIPVLSSIRCIPVHWCRIINYKSLPCIGYLTQRPTQIKNSFKSDFFETRNIPVTPVTFCSISSIGLLGAVINSKFSNSDRNILSGSFVQKEQFREIHKSLFNPVDEQIINHLSYEDIKDRNILFSRLFWLDIPFSEISFYYKRNEDSNNQEITNESFSIPSILNKKTQNNYNNPIGFFGI